MYSNQALLSTLSRGAQFLIMCSSRKVNTAKTGKISWDSRNCSRWRFGSKVVRWERLSNNSDNWLYALVRRRDWHCRPGLPLCHAVRMPAKLNNSLTIWWAVWWIGEFLKPGTITHGRRQTAKCRIGAHLPQQGILTRGDLKVYSHCRDNFFSDFYDYVIVV